MRTDLFGSSLAFELEFFTDQLTADTDYHVLAWTVWADSLQMHGRSADQTYPGGVWEPTSEIVLFGLE